MRKKVDAPAIKSFASLQAAATQGDAHAQYLLGERYRHGEGVKQDFTAMLRWFRAAAEQGEPNAQNNLGSMYRNGIGVTADEKQAIYWYLRAAEGGSTDAMYNLGKSYLHGPGTAIDYAVAAEWFSQAARAGHIEATCDLGTMYRMGQGVEQNFLAASTFHVIAALEGDVTAMRNLYDYREEIKELAVGRNQVAALNLVKMYDRGLGVEKDRALMLAWLTWAQKDCVPDSDESHRTEVADMLQFYRSALDADVKKKARAQHRAIRKRADVIAKTGKAPQSQQPS